MCEVECPVQAQLHELKLSTVGDTSDNEDDEEEEEEEFMRVVTQAENMPDGVQGYCFTIH